MRKATKPPSSSKTGRRAAPPKRASKTAKSSASKAKAAKSKTAKAKTKKSARAKPAKPTARSPSNAKGCCIIKYMDGREEARNGVTQKACHEIEISNPDVAATRWQKGVCA